jgi:hypothetical protein
VGKHAEIIRGGFALVTPAMKMPDTVAKSIETTGSARNGSAAICGELRIVVMRRSA